MKRAILFWARAAIAAVFFIVPFLIWYRAVNSEHGYDRVGAELASLGMKISAYKLDTGLLPKTLQSLLVNEGVANWQGPYAKSTDLLDPRGRAYRYEVIDSTKPQIRLFDLDAEGAVFKSVIYEPYSE